VEGDLLSHRPLCICPLVFLSPLVKRRQTNWLICLCLIVACLPGPWYKCHCSRPPGLRNIATCQAGSEYAAWVCSQMLCCVLKQCSYCTISPCWFEWFEFAYSVRIFDSSIILRTRFHSPLFVLYERLSTFVGPLATH
jgi:hypothetical protein